MSGTHCENTQEQLLAYLDGSLTMSATFEVERHLESCAECRGALSELRAMDEALQAVGNVAVHDIAGVDLSRRVGQDAIALSERVKEEQLRATPDEAKLHAYFEGALGTIESERVAQFVGGQPAVRRDLLGIGAIEAELEALAAEEARFELEDDLTDEVMRAIHHRNIEDFGERRRSAVRSLVQTGLLAASLLAAWGLYALYAENESRPLPENLAQDVGAVPTDGDNAAESGIGSVPEGTPVLAEDNSPTGTDVEIAPAIVETVPNEDVLPGAPSRGRGTFQEAVGLYRLALLKDVEAMERVVGWAQVDPETSEALLAEGGLSAEARVGLADFLPGEAGARILEAAVRHDPRDPYLRARLAEQYVGMAGHSNDRIAQLDAWRALDPENSLPHFLAAQALLEVGDTEGALASLDEGMTLDLADAFSRSSALDLEQALLADGSDPEVARFLAVATAGTEEYTDYALLAGSLLQYSDYYIATNEPETAERIITATQQLGSQVATGAVLANEQVAGLDIQLDALNSLRALFDLAGEPEEGTGENLLAQMSGILRDLANLTELIAQIGALFGEGDGTAIAAILDAILEGGNLDIVAGGE